MGTTLTGTTPQDTYDSLIKVTDNGPLSGTAKYLSDGLGNDSVLALSTARVGIGTTSPSSTFKLTVNSGSNVNSFLNGDKISFSRTSDNATDVAYLSRTNDLGVNGTANIHGYDGIQFRTQGPESVKATITSAGNVGIGVTPSAWGASDKAIELGGSNSSTYTGLNVTSLAKNCYYDGTNWIYEQSSVTSLLYQQSFTGNHIFYTAPTGTAGAAITFTEAVRIDSNGIKFNGDTAAANALDDYEEGTWTPTFSNAANISNFASATGKYTKIGNVVNFNVSFLADVASSAAESVVDITLPFVSYSTANKSVGHVAFFSGTGADRFGVGSLFLGTSSNSVINMYIAANQMNASGTGIEFRASYTYFV